MKIYNRLKEVPENAIKAIQGGNLKGFSDINPQWRIEIMTDVFGICGIGWKFNVVNKWMEDGDNGEKSAFADVELFVKIDDKWSDAIPGNGGSVFVGKNKHGYFTSDEAYKMAITDALSTSMKMLGVGANIYRGLDKTKYTNDNSSKGTKSDTIPDDNKEWLNKFMDKDGKKLNPKWTQVILRMKEKGLEVSKVRDFYKVSKPEFQKFEEDYNQI